MRLLTPLLATAALGLAPAAASADTVVAPAPGAVNLAAGGGYLVWFAPNEDTGWRLVVRAPDGTVSTPDVAGFASPARASIGSDRPGADGRRLLAVYSRAGDVHALDLRTGAEERVRGASTRAYDEDLPSISYGSLVFVRRGGARDGVFSLSGSRLKRIVSATPRELASSGTRIAYLSGRHLIIRRASGEGRPSRIRTSGRVTGLQLSRYTLTYLVRGEGRVFRTPRFGGSSPVDRVTVAGEASRQLPASTQSIANSDSDPRWYLDAEGVKAIAPKLTFG